MDRVLFDPAWLRRSYRRCLWDGGERAPGAEFCSESCQELYEGWEGFQMVFDQQRALEVFEEPDDRPPG